MNSYNENLHAAILDVLRSQKLELKSLNSQYNASLFSLYYAQDDYITTAEKLQLAYAQYDFQKETLSQAIIDSNMSTNVLISTTDVKERVDGVVGNTATAAANTQIAANAIVKLASDVSAIYSIMSAGDFDSELYDEAQEANKRMQETAYLAETASQQSMEASSLIAGVAATNLQSIATSANTGISSLLDSVTTDFNNINKQVVALHQKLKIASKEEKGSTKNLETTNDLYNVSETAYQLSNEELNLALSVSIVNDKENKNHQYTVSFNPLKSPFKKQDTDVKPYPVEAYYILLVKENVSSVFSIEKAETVINENDDSYIKIDATNSTTSYSKSILVNELKDVNGDPFQLGDSYVIFVFATLSEAYKKSRNVFEDYLTAPTTPFTITNQLALAYDIAVNLVPKSSTTQQLCFNVNRILSSKVTYRCVFLPDNAPLIKKSLATTELDVTENRQLQFCFNLTLAEHISAGSYTIVENVSPPKGNTGTLLEGTLELTNTMTDNFGNRLIKGNTYIPVIISMSDDIASINKTITNVLSDFKNTKSFTYLG